MRESFPCAAAAHFHVFQHNVAARSPKDAFPARQTCAGEAYRTIRLPQGIQPTIDVQRNARGDAHLNAWFNNQTSAGCHQGIAS
jgi:hypothetical protein